MGEYSQEHASQEELLDIRDGVTTENYAHVQGCDVCQRKLDALGQTGDAIGHSLLGQAATAQDEQLERVWERIENSVAGEDVKPEASIALLPKTNQFQWNSLSTAVYALAVAIMFTGLVGVYGNNERDELAQQTAQQTLLLQASIEELMLNSRGLEAVLQQVADQGGILNASERRVADRLYWRLSHLDQMINERTRDDRQDSERIKTLWGSRIDALTELNQLYSNELQQVGFETPETL